MRSLIMLLVLLAISVQPLTGQRGASKTDCHLKKLDICLEQVEKISNDPKSSELLKTVSGVEEICKQTLGTEHCTRDVFKKCATGMHREMFKFFSEHFEQSMQQFCKDDEPRRKFLKESPCIVDKVLKTPQYKAKCVDNYLATLDKTSAQTETTKKINTACCSYNRWEECMYKMIADSCGTDARSSMEYFIQKALGTTTNAICNDASFKYTSKRCTKLYAPPNSKPKGKNSDNPITKYIVAYMGFLFN